jgi:hypothetical protein
MHIRSRAAATTALLLTASVSGLAAIGASAQATTHTASRAAAAPVITITANKSGVTLSTHKIRPGNTMFKVVRGTANGSMQLVRLKHGYTIAHLLKDVGPLMNGKVKVVQRVDRNVEFYGGTSIPDPGAGPNKWGTDIDKSGTYYLINLKRGDVASFSARGVHRTASLPKADGRVGMKGSMSFKAPASDPHKGWMKTTNNATQPHFVDLSQVKKSTTKQDVQNYLANPSGPPPFFKRGGGHTSTEVVSPGHTVIWKYHTHTGRYLAACFYPDKHTGVPHFFMGMFALINLTS